MPTYGRPQSSIRLGRLGVMQETSSVISSSPGPAGPAGPVGPAGVDAAAIQFIQTVKFADGKSAMFLNFNDGSVLKNVIGNIEGTDLPISIDTDGVVVINGSIRVNGNIETANPYSLITGDIKDTIDGGEFGLDGGTF